MGDKIEIDLSKEKVFFSKAEWDFQQKWMEEREKELPKYWAKFREDNGLGEAGEIEKMVTNHILNK